jgi:hypothetical protein
MGLPGEGAEPMDDTPQNRKVKIRIRERVKTKVKSQEAIRTEWWTRLKVIAQIVGWIAGIALFAICTYVFLDRVDHR